MIPLRGAAEIAGRLELDAAATVLLVHAPPELEALLTGAARPGCSVRSSEARALRSEKEGYDLVLVWQESRVGSRAVLDAAVKRLAPGGRLWVATKAFEKSGLVQDREARLSAWHVAYRFAYST